jgi:hypothetical protein
MNNKSLKYSFLILILLIKFQITCFAQSLKLEEYSNKLLFNFHTDTPDSNLCKFIQKHISAIYCQPKSKTDTVRGWSANDTSAVFVYPPISSIHSLYFSKHPFLNEKFSVGKIEIQAQEMFKDRVGIFDISLYLYFHEKKDAINLFNKMIDTLTKMSSIKKITNYNETKKAEFTDNTIKNKFPFGVQLILTKDCVNENSSYYILFTPHNNL